MSSRTALRAAILAVPLSIGSCGIENPWTPSITAEQRLLVVCEAWLSVFSRINTRDELGFATSIEVDAVDNALPILNPICQSDGEVDIGLAERVLVQVLDTSDRRFR